jgi:pimeloyl-ACP methyl ester carboxylesterase
LTTATRWVSGVARGRIDINPQSRTKDAYLPWSTDGAYGGICGTHLFSDIPHRRNTPVVFVHGNSADASVWEPMMQSFLEQGDTGEDVWAITFRRSSPTHEEMARQLDAFVSRVREHTGYDTVHVVSHSLGVTGVRYWLERCDRHDWVDTFVGLAGANHGLERGSALASDSINFGPGRVSSFLDPRALDDPDHPLARLNQNETPGDIDYYTVRASEDRFFRADPESPKLEGATDTVLETTHCGLLSADISQETVYSLVRK